MNQKIRLSDACELFILDAVAQGFTAHTVRFYRGRSKLIVRWLEEQGLALLEELTPKLIRQYMIDMQERGLSSAYIHGHACAIRAFCKHRLAFLAYRELLVEPMNDLVIAGGSSRELYRVRQGVPVLVQIGRTLVSPTYAGVTLDVHWRFNHIRNRREPQDLHQLACFARWLHVAQPEIVRWEQERAFTRAVLGGVLPVESPVPLVVERDHHLRPPTPAQREAYYAWHSEPMDG